MLPLLISRVCSVDALSSLVATSAPSQPQSEDALAGDFLCKLLLDDPTFQMSLHPRWLSRAEVLDVGNGLLLALPDRAVIQETSGGLLRADVGVLVCIHGTCQVKIASRNDPLLLVLGEGDCLLFRSSAVLSLISDDGARVARLWAQSLVRSEAVREALHDLASSSAFADLLGQDDPEGAESLKTCYHELLGMYAET